MKKLFGGVLGILLGKYHSDAFPLLPLIAAVILAIDGV